MHSGEPRKTQCIRWYCVFASVIAGAKPAPGDHHEDLP